MLYQQSNPHPNDLIYVLFLKVLPLLTGAAVAAAVFVAALAAAVFLPTAPLIVLITVLLAGAFLAAVTTVPELASLA